jgi:PEP-CTERM motif
MRISIAAVLRSIVLLALTFGVFAGHAFATTSNACPGTTPGSSLNTINVAAGSATPDINDGCFAGDKTLTDLFVNGVACTGTATGCTTSTNSNTELFTTSTVGTGAVAGPAGTLSVTFDDGAGSNIGHVSGGVGTDTAAINYVVQSNHGTPAGAGLGWFISGNLALSMVGSINETSNSAAGTNTIQVTETFCINSAVSCVGVNEGSITAEITFTNNGNGVGSAGTITTVTFLNCSAGANVGTCNGGATGGSIALASPVTEIAVMDSISLSRQAGSNAVLNLSSLTNAFDEAALALAPVPEPGTFALFGAALLGVGFARFRSRKS